MARLLPADQEIMSLHLAAGAACCHIILHTYTALHPISLQVWEKGRTVERLDGALVLAFTL